MTPGNQCINTTVALHVGLGWVLRFLFCINYQFPCGIKLQKPTVVAGLIMCPLLVAFPCIPHSYPCSIHLLYHQYLSCTWILISGAACGKTQSRTIIIKAISNSNKQAKIKQTDTRQVYNKFCSSTFGAPANTLEDSLWGPGSLLVGQINHGASMSEGIQDNQARTLSWLLNRRCWPGRSLYFVSHRAVEPLQYS